MSTDGTDNKFKVFISYSRADQAFADELFSGLQVMGFDPSLDRHAIAEGEDWKARLGALIAVAETVVFVISPDSAASHICDWEVEEAVSLAKRIVPVLWKAPAPHPVPPRLAALNYVRFDGHHSFMGGLRALDRALRADLDWLRGMARWLLRALEWDRGGRTPNRLLSGSDIAEIKAWAASQPLAAPNLTELHLDFIKASEIEEQAQIEVATRQIAERERLVRNAEADRKAREAALAVAEEAQRAAARRQRSTRWLLAAVAGLILLMLGNVTWQSHDVARREMLVYTSLAAIALREENFDRAMRFALQGYPAEGSPPWTPSSTELEATLAGAAMMSRLHLTLNARAGQANVAAFSPDGKRVAIATWDNSVTLWNAISG